MTHIPTVSVMMPCYNDRPSLPWALGSLLAQTFEDWELILVDDGSNDRPEEIVAQVNDPRIRLVRLPENRGRGYARQVALDNARGEFMAMLDADDWMFPTRLEREYEHLQCEPSVTLVSAGMATVDNNNDITGVRCVGEAVLSSPFRAVKLSFAHAPSMFRHSSVGTSKYDSVMRQGEDVDFLIRLLYGNRYLVLSTVEYAYAEYDPIFALTAARAQRYVRRQCTKQVARMPVQAASEIGKSIAKEVIYRAGASLGLDDRFVRARSRRPTPAETRAFQSARSTVESLVSKHFSNE